MSLSPLMFTKKYRFSYTRVCCSGAMAKTCKTRFNCFFPITKNNPSRPGHCHPQGIVRRCCLTRGCACVWPGGGRLAKYGRVWPVCHHHAGSQPLLPQQPGPARGVRGATMPGRNQLWTTNRTLGQIQKSDERFNLLDNFFASCSPEPPKSLRF